jgi:hypothetical protein
MSFRSIDIAPLRVRASFRGPSSSERVVFRHHVLDVMPLNLAPLIVAKSREVVQSIPALGRLKDQDAAAVTAGVAMSTHTSSNDCLRDVESINTRSFFPAAHLRRGFGS